jgi:hypothetical protein
MFGDALGVDGHELAELAVLLAEGLAGGIGAASPRGRADADLTGGFGENRSATVLRLSNSSIRSPCSWGSTQRLTLSRPRVGGWRRVGTSLRCGP